MLLFSLVHYPCYFICLHFLFIIILQLKKEFDDVQREKEELGTKVQECQAELTALYDKVSASPFAP